MSVQNKHIGILLLKMKQPDDTSILPKLGALLSVKSANNRAVIKDHMARNFLALSSVEVFSDSCR